jgi:hypothetical protein
MLLPRVGGGDQFSFFRTYLSGLLEDLTFSTHLHVWFKYDRAPLYQDMKYVSGCPKVSLEPGLVAGVLTRIIR